MLTALLIPRTALFKTTSTSHAVLTKPVSRLTGRDVLTLIVLIVYKYILAALGLLPALEPSDDPDARQTFDLPALSLTSTLAINSQDVLRFDASTAPLLPSSSSSSSSKTPSEETTPKSSRTLLVPGLINPLMSILLANRTLPIQPFGCVNTKNTFTYLDAEACRNPTQTLDLTRGITVSASLGGLDNAGRRVKRGIEFDVLFEVAALRTGDTSPTTIFKQVGTVLAYLPRSTKPPFQESLHPTPGSQPAKDEGRREWTTADGEIVELRLDATGKWAAVCKDYNPIHMSSILARLFGFPGKIAHGNHALARALEQLARNPGAVPPEVAERVEQLIGSSDVQSVLEVQFRRPMVLPARMGLQVANVKNGFALRIVKNEKEHVVAEWTTL
jgi:acyl dehydratase